MKNEICELNCDEMYCDVCLGQEETPIEMDRRNIEIEYIVSKMNVERAIKMCEEIEVLLKTSRDLLDYARERFQKALNAIK